MPLPIPPPDAVQQVEALIASTSDDGALRAALSDLTDRAWLPALGPHFGPALYERNPSEFRLFLLSVVDAYCVADPQHACDVWRGPEGGRLEAWLDAADRVDDVEMFRVLLRWRLGSLPEGQRTDTWRRELLRRFQSAESQAERVVTLDKMTCHLALDEATAVALYECDPECTPRFVRRHMPATTGEGEGYWASLSSLARRCRDQDLFFAVYRKTVEAEQWVKDVDMLADRMEEGTALTVELMRRHPEADRRNVSSVLYALLRKRGEDVMPYALHAVKRSAAGLQAEPARHADLIRLADERGWLVLWTRLLQATGREGDIDREVRRLVDDQRRGDEEILSRFDRLARLRPVHRTDRAASANVVLLDETAVKTYLRFPQMFHVQLRRRLRVGPLGYTLLLDKAVRKRDEPLIDFLASLVVVVDTQQEWARREVGPMLDVLHDEYDALCDRPEVLSRRVARVLGFVPSGAAAKGYEALAETNKLAALFWSLESSVWLGNAEALRDLLEAPDVQAQYFAVRQLSSSVPMAREITLDNVRLLQAALTRPWSRSMRRAVLSALENAAVDEADARPIATALRELVEPRPRGRVHDDIIATLGRVIGRHPTLRLPSEQTSFEVAP